MISSRNIRIVIPRAPLTRSRKRPLAGSFCKRLQTSCLLRINFQARNFRYLCGSNSVLRSSQRCVPLLLAFISRNVFYAMNNDVLSPVRFGGLFLCVLQWLRTSRPSLLLGAFTGLAIAATYLTKLSNLPLIVVALVAIIATLRPAIRQKPETALVAFGRLFSALRFRLGVGLSGQNISLAISPDQQQKSLCLVGDRNRLRTGGSIQFLGRKVSDFLARPHHQFLARRSKMARSAFKLSSCRRILCHFLASVARRCAPWVAKESRPLNVSAASDWDSGFSFHRIG